MSSSPHTLPQTPPDPATPQGTTVRRHHTITAASRTARAQAKDIISEEALADESPWNDDEPVDHDWVGGVGAVGEKTSLHRQASLPTRYHRGFQTSASANLTPKTAINSLAAIAGHEGDEEPWNIANYNVNDDEQQNAETQQQLDLQVANSPMSSQFNQQQGQQVPSPPPAGSGVRRHVSLTYGAAVGGPRKMNTGLKRSGTLQATVPNHSQSSNTTETSEYQEANDYNYDPEDSSSNPSTGYTLEEEAYLRQQVQQQQQQQQQYGSSANRGALWGQGNDWRAGGNAPQGTGTIDDVQRALSALEIASGVGGGYTGGAGQYAGTQASQPPRFSGTASRGSNNGNGNNVIGGNGNRGSGEYDAGRRTPSRSQNANWQQQRNDWDGSQQQQGSLGPRRSNTNLQYSYQQGGHGKTGSSGGGAIPAVPAIPQQYLQQNPQQGYGQQQGGRPGLGLATNFGSGNGNGNGNMSSGQTPVQPFVNTPIDVPTLIAAKGYNPATFDIKPSFARFFVIKSYTEDDVHKSLKYEIWSSTEPGNKRLDKAFKETAGRGPIYLFFSVNASGHFCGMAEMLTPVDYTRSSTVWASDKWKGVFKVRWIFVRDIPNSNLRHIKLNNTQERKPVTNSRDTQELLPDAGQEMLRIFYTHPARTSLLQDFAFYELQAMQKMQTSGGLPPPTAPTIPNIPTSGTNSPPSVVHSPQLSHASASSSTSSHSNNNSFSSNSAAYQTSSYGMNPLMHMGMGVGGIGGMGITAPPGGMGMGMGGMNLGGLGGMQGMGMQGMGLGGNQFGVQSQTHQAVMRHSSPTPSQGQQGSQGSQGYTH